MGGDTTQAADLSTRCKCQIKKYWDLKSCNYDRVLAHKAVSVHWKAVLAEIFPQKMRILDVGTGTGFLASLLAELGHEVVGIDISRGMVEVAKKKSRGLDVEFRIADAESLPFKQDSFDAVICRHLIWTLPNPQKAIREWVRVIKPGGKVVAIDGKWLDNGVDRLKWLMGSLVVAAYEKRNPWRSRYGKEIWRMLPFYNGSSPEKVVEMFEAAGLTVTSVKDLKWLREVQRRKMPPVYWLMWDSKSYYLVEGYKPEFND